MSTFDHLALFGADVSVNPTPSRLPKGFNHAAARMWARALESKELEEARSAKLDTGALWEIAIKQYLKQCAKADVFPFTGRDDFQEMATRFLTNGRKALRDYINSSGILKKLTIRSVDRKVRFSGQNFSVEVTAHLKPIEDPTFSKWLTTIPSPGFRAEKNVLTKSVHAHVDVVFQNGSDPRLTYKVLCVSPIKLIDPRYTTRAKLESYVQNKLWLPILRDHRFDDAGSRLF